MKPERGDDGGPETELWAYRVPDNAIGLRYLLRISASASFSRWKAIDRAMTRDIRSPTDCCSNPIWTFNLAGQAPLACPVGETSLYL